MKLTLVLLFGLALWQPAGAAARQDGPRGCARHAERVYTTGQVDQKAKFIHRPTPDYPERMRRKRASGRVMLRAVLRPDGRVTDIEILETTDEAFNKASIEAARRIRFEPAIKDGCPVAQTTVLINNYNTY